MSFIHYNDHHETNKARADILSNLLVANADLIVWLKKVLGD